MKAETLHEAIHAQPFRPFVLMLADGTRWEVTRPEWILHPEGARTAIVMAQDEGFRALDVGPLLGIEVAPPVAAGSPAPEPNGED